MKKLLLLVLIFYSKSFSQDLPFLYSNSYQPILIDQKQYPSYKAIREVQDTIKNFNNKKLEKMLKEGLNPNIYAPLKHSFTMLQFASSLHNKEAVKLLLKYGANPNILRDSESKYLMPIVYFLNDTNMVKLFLKYDAAINVYQPYYPIINCNDIIVQPPLFYANSRESIEFLVSKEGDIVQKNARGETILDSNFMLERKYKNFKKWLIKTYKLPTTYLRCSTQVHKIIKVIHTPNGYKEYDINGTMVYEYNANK